mmetsp:Transcript_16236/g.28426  ORF Transcript_16236/g.28426 Transcript_16236/m.28426 type:complete len:83 (-) Transcript_16236:33-281(-)
MVASYETIFSLDSVVLSNMNWEVSKQSQQRAPPSVNTVVFLMRHFGHARLPRFAGSVNELRCASALVSSLIATRVSQFSWAS